jgi:hypothetical protein
MMMNDFGVPANEHEMMMMKPHEKVMAESGVESNFWNVALPIASTVIGAIGKKNTADKKAKAQNEATERQFEYDTLVTDRQNDKLDADYAYAYEGYEINKKNQEMIARLTDEKNLRRYNYDLQIRNAQQKAQEQQYAKSEKLYHMQLGYNQQALQDARERTLIKQHETNQKAAFDNEDSVIQSIQAQGALMASGQTGRSSTKAFAAISAERGRIESRLMESLVSSRRNTALTLKEISRDKFGADLSAFANRMLKPGELPMPIKPVKTPIAELQAPRALGEYDYMPDPVKGVKATGGSWLGVASSVVSGVGTLGEKLEWKGFTS